MGPRASVDDNSSTSKLCVGQRACSLVSAGTGRLAQSVASRKVPGDVGPEVHYLAGFHGSLQVKTG